MVDLQQPVLDIGLVVGDLDAALDFYRDKLGLKSTRQISLDTESARQAGVSQQGFESQYLEFGEVNLKLVHFENHPQPQPTVADGTTGFRYITMWEKDIQATYDEWKLKGVDFLSTPIRRTPELQMVFMKDPEGNLIEILGP